MKKQIERHQITTYLDLGTYGILLDEAKHQKISVAAVIRDAVRSHLGGGQYWDAVAEMIVTDDLRSYSRKER